MTSWGFRSYGIRLRLMKEDVKVLAGLRLGSYPWISLQCYLLATSHHPTNTFKTK